MKNKLLDITLLLLIAQIGLAQKDFNIWHISFQHGISINFNTSPPTILDSPIDMAESGATICDPHSGELILFANHQSIWNANNNILSNGTNLEGSNSTAQGTMLLPHPCGCNKYILLENDIGEFPLSLPDYGLSYSIIDMNLENGSGVVTEKNIPISNQISEPMIAINDTSNGYWLICHKIESYEYVVYHIGNNGIDQDVKFLTTNNYVDNPGQGGPCATFDGSKIALGQKDNAFIEILNFDINHGQLESDTTLLFDSTDPDFQFAYSVVFSPDGSKLYAADYGHLYQFDFLNGNNIDRHILYRRDTSDIMAAFLALQLAPTGQIYVTEDVYSDNADYIGVINSPDQAGLACNFNPFGLEIPKIARAFGLPAINKSVFAKNYQPFDYKVDFDIEKLDSNEIRLLNTSMNVDSFQWDLGDGTYSNEFSLSHTYFDTGQYHILLTGTNKFGCQKIVDKLVTINDLLVSSKFTEIPDLIEIFPNPVDEILNITSLKNIDEIDLYSITGKLFYTYSEQGIQHIKIDLKGLPSQMYIVKIMINKNVYLEKIIKI